MCVVVKCCTLFVDVGTVMMCRAYLKSVAKKLAEDVDNLKNTAGSMGRVSYHKD